MSSGYGLGEGIRKVRAKADIMSVIAKADDPNMKTMLILMLAVLEEIGSKVDAMRADEQGLRDAVLNGYSKNHDSHHEWIEKQMESEKADEASKRKIRDGFLERALWAIVVVGAGSGWLLK